MKKTMRALSIAVVSQLAMFIEPSILYWSGASLGLVLLWGLVERAYLTPQPRQYLNFTGGTISLKDDTGKVIQTLPSSGKAEIKREGGRLVFKGMPPKKKGTTYIVQEVVARLSRRDDFLIVLRDNNDNPVGLGKADWKVKEA